MLPDAARQAFVSVGWGGCRSTRARSGCQRQTTLLSHAQEPVHRERGESLPVPSSAWWPWGRPGVNMPTATTGTADRAAHHIPVAPVTLAMRRSRRPGVLLRNTSTRHPMTSSATIRPSAMPYPETVASSPEPRTTVSVQSLPAHVDELLLHMTPRAQYLGPVGVTLLKLALELACQRAMHSSSPPDAILAEDAASRPSWHAHWARARAMLDTVTELQMDLDLVLAAALRGSRVSASEIRREFGSAVADLLEQEQSIQNVLRAATVHADATGLRQLVLTLARDWRAIALHLADALYDMRLAAVLDATEPVPDLSSSHSLLRSTTPGDGVLQARKARASTAPDMLALRVLEVYSPLAHQLGMFYIQTELEELAFLHLFPAEGALLRREVGERFEACAALLDAARCDVERALVQDARIQRRASGWQVRGRVKGLYSTYRKVVRERRAVDDVLDLLALRVVVTPRRAEDEIDLCYDVMECIEQRWPVLLDRRKDFIRQPKPNGYQSLHSTLCIDGWPFELQVRSERMHRLAEYGRAAHWLYKYRGGRPAAVQRTHPRSSGEFEFAASTSPSAPPGRMPAEEVVLDDAVTATLDSHTRYLMALRHQIVSLQRSVVVVVDADTGQLLHLPLGATLADAGAFDTINGRWARADTPLHTGDRIACILRCRLRDESSGRATATATRSASMLLPPA
ncbi:hypothetical protein CDCA_CDCA12G3497 [Cyanidium caldarium]|uniref:RelA/SpoT domain-containing protein n=1 Tax=Cyanidium caldarium TaxID=2771 RepID=A0AAV9IYW3_CYACA|nr:hypothetical protein CDCA_CDCA12G3497 [Cyanidium caldarium]|eukprot:ctg_93.g14